MSWLSPRTLRGWLLLIMLGAIVASQLVLLTLLFVQQSSLRLSFVEGEAFRRAVGIVQLAKTAKPEQRFAIAAIASSPTFAVEFAPAPRIEAKDANPELSQLLARQLRLEPDAIRVVWKPAENPVADNTFYVATDPFGPPPPPGPPRAPPAPGAPEPGFGIQTQTFEAPVGGVAPYPPPAIAQAPAAPEPPAPPQTREFAPNPNGPPYMVRGFAPRPGGGRVGMTMMARTERLDIAVRLADNSWLNMGSAAPPVALLAWPLLAALFSAAVLAVAAIWAGGKLARPLAGLTAAAERFGRGDDTVQAPEDGPADLQHAAQAFNAMSRRVRRTLAEQRTLLSAIGHDLRTPIASLRVRTELVKDPETQARMFATLDEMQRLTESALAAARGGDMGEPLRTLDLPSLVESVCDDLADAGQPVTHAELPPARIEGRALELKRALRNLIENAIRYGKSADVGLTLSPGWVEIHVDDKGPGIPPDEIAKVFEPFVRLEASRSADTGGHGLGLTIARATAERHGGEIKLENRAGGGLRATLKLPLS